MDYREREALKDFARQCERRGDLVSLEKTLIMIAHWMRQGVVVPFSEYAGQWVEAQRERDDGNASTSSMRERWPFSGKRCINKSGSDYYPQPKEVTK